MFSNISSSLFDLADVIMNYAYYWPDEQEILLVEKRAIKPLSIGHFDELLPSLEDTDHDFTRILPEEILLNISSYLTSPIDLCNVSKLNRTMHDGKSIFNVFLSNRLQSVTQILFGSNYLLDTFLLKEFPQKIIPYLGNNGSQDVTKDTHILDLIRLRT